jgi:very-short-patch-repair endonuclease
MVSHTTAATLWGIDSRTNDEVHLLVPPARRPRARGVVVHRGEVAQRDRRVRDRVPVTSPARTLVDLAGMLDGEFLEAALEDMLHRGLTTAFAVLRCLDAVGGTGRSGSQRLRRLLTDRDDEALESRLEVKVWRLLRSAGLRPVRQYEVPCGERTYRLDFAWPKLRVAVEAEGFSAHGGTRIKFVADRRRAADLASAEWSVIPVTWDDCTTHPGSVIQRVRTALVHAA